MRTVTLGATGRKTTQLGYGCSSLMGAMGRRASLAALEAAYEAGIRHYDVAPMYGYGEAEGCLGEFLKRHPQGITVTTKFGIEPPRRRGLIRLARRAVGPVLKAAPLLKKRLARAAGAVTAPVADTPFIAQTARGSLERSLRELQVEHIDLLLLHEVRAEQLQDDGLLRFLEDCVRSGKIAGSGVGSERARVVELLRTRRPYCGTVQHEWSILDAFEAHDAAGSATDKLLAEVPSIHHRALTDNYRTIAQDLRASPALCHRWSDAVGADLDDDSMLAALMLKAALEVHPESVLLVSSKHGAHLRANVRAAGEAALREPALRLAALVAREGLPSRSSVEAAC